MAEMRACNALEDVLEVISDEALALQPAEAAVALYRVAYLSKSADTAGASDWRAARAENGKGLSNKRFSNLPPPFPTRPLAALAELRDSQTLKALLAVVISSSKALSARQVSTCMWALATLRVPSRSTLVALCFRWNCAHLGAASLLDNAQFFWALGTLGYVPDATFFDSLTRRCGQGLE